VNVVCFLPRRPNSDAGELPRRKHTIFVMLLIWFCDILSVYGDLILIQLQSVKYCWLKISFSSLPDALDFVLRMDLAIVTVYELPGDQQNKI
jgi:hypothetical protein